MTGNGPIVIGGAKSMGAATARSFAGARAHVMIADLKGDDAAETGADVRGMACDVAKDDRIEASVAETAKAFGTISALVNDVGWGRACEDPLAVSPEQMVES